VQLQFCRQHTRLAEKEKYIRKRHEIYPGWRPVQWKLRQLFHGAQYDYISGTCRSASLPRSFAITD
jgi:hypothetical protein